MKKTNFLCDLIIIGMFLLILILKSLKSKFYSIKKNDRWTKQLITSRESLSSHETVLPWDEFEQIQIEQDCKVLFR